ncbi:MAG: tetratricopeptide repeat protein [Burkholderiales bacterium]
MSLINKMLRDLDKRHAPQDGAGGSAGSQSAALTQHLRPVKSGRKLSGSFWYVMSVLMLVSLAWVAWITWQIMPHPVVTELAYQSARGKASAPKDAAPPASVSTSESQIAAKSPSPAPLSSAPTPPAQRATPTTQGTTEAFKPDMLRLATELTSPIPAKRDRARAKAPRRPKNMAASASESATGALTSAMVPDPGKIDRRANATPRDRADAEFRRASELVNQGRIAEAMEGFRAALSIDPGHEPARQTMIALLLEAKRVNDAAAVLQEGMALNPGNTGFAMLLARIMVERHDIPGALALLQQHAPVAGGDPEYHAFVAALYQRLGRHKEAIGEYQIALRLAPSTGVWWVGMGISSQAAERPKDALDAFKRAKATGNLAPGLVTFVDQRLHQLR